MRKYRIEAMNGLTDIFPKSIVNDLIESGNIRFDFSSLNTKIVGLSNDANAELHFEWGGHEFWIRQLNEREKLHDFIQYEVTTNGGADAIKALEGMTRQSFLERNPPPLPRFQYCQYPEERWYERPTGNRDFIVPSLSTVYEQILSFPDQESIYVERGVPWKRSYLLVGPPGCGKTTFIKTVMGLERYKSVITVGDLSSDGELNKTTEELFTWKIKTSEKPCLLIFEEISRQVNAENIQAILNGLDGLNESNLHGVFILATDNHPERLDQALIRRPGRFDRVIEVGVMTNDYIDKFAIEINKKARIDDMDTSIFHGLPIAYIKEIFNISVIEAINSGREPCNDDLIRNKRLILNQD